jgi:hypothetical protein
MLDNKEQALAEAATQKAPVPLPAISGPATIGEWADSTHEHDRGFNCGDADCTINSGERQPNWHLLAQLFGGIL